MALKTKRNKRSLVTLKRTEPSLKEQEVNAFTKMIIDGEISLDELIPPEDIDPEILKNYPTIDSILDDASKNMTGDIQHDTELMDEILTKHADHPQFFRLQMAVMRTIANNLTPEQKEELYVMVTSKNSDDLEPDQSLIDKICETADLVDAGRATKAIKSLQACIRRIEAKHTPTSYNDKPVLSLSSVLEEKLYYKANNLETKTSNYYQPPAPYALAYAMYGEMMLQKGNYPEAFEAINQAITWNPVDANNYLQLANMLTQIADDARAIELLEKAYPCIMNADQLLHFYMLHSAILLNSEDSEANTPLAVRLQRLSRYLVAPESADTICNVAEKLSDAPVDVISRDEFVAQLKAHNIPFGAHELAIQTLNECIDEYRPDGSQDTLNTMKAQRDKLSSCFDDLKEI